MVGQYGSNFGALFSADGSVSVLLDLAASDYIELMALQNSGGALNVSADVRTFFSVVWYGY
jgi:hypothetical protein